MPSNKSQILFYRPNEAYGWFSNFSNHPVELWGLTYPTSEHAYQAQKFSPHRPDLVELVQKAQTPKQAALLGRDKTLPLREDWEDMVLQPPGIDAACIEKLKDLIMYEVIYRKFTQHEYLNQILANTGSAEIVEDSPIDYYWGWGRDHSGKNKLGQILMAVRERILNGK